MDKEQVVLQRAITTWINRHVKLDAPVVDLGIESQEGALLCHVVAHCLRTKVRGISKDRKLNVSLALDTADEQELQASDVENVRMGPLLNFYWKLVEKHLEPVESLKDRLAKALGEEHISDLHIFGDGRLLVTMIEKKRPGLIANMNSPDLCGDAIFQLETHFGLPSRSVHAADLACADEKSLRIFLALIADCFPAQIVVAAPVVEKTPPRVVVTPSRLSEKKASPAPVAEAEAQTPPRVTVTPGRISEKKQTPEQTVNYVPSNAHAPSGGAYAKPAQSAAARAKDLKRRSANAKSRGSSSQQGSVIEEEPQNE